MKRKTNNRKYDKKDQQNRNSKHSSRRPKNNIVFCVECGKRKQLWETEAEALRFIQYNHDNIEHENGYAPVRAYHCPCCGGWHITSRQDYVEPKKSNTDRLIERYRHDKENFALFKEKHRLETKDNLRLDEDKFEYICLRLTNEARMRLYANIPEDYAEICRKHAPILHHVTLLHRSQYDKENLGGKAAKVIRFVKMLINDPKQSARIHFIVDGIGKSDKAVAYRAKLSIPCRNSLPHITICTLGDGRPVDSNNITEWVNIPKMSVDGIVEVIYSEPKKPLEEVKNDSDETVNII